MRIKLTALAAAAVLAAFPAIGPAVAQDYPTRPITLVVPFAAGGPTDIIARIVGEHMGRTLGKNIVVENIVGAGGTIASSRVAKAKPDGYTIIMGHMGTHAASVALYPKLTYKPDADFAPIGMAAGTPVLILARKDFPAKDLKEFVAYVKANVAKLNMAHAGIGSVSFTTCLLLNSIMEVKPTAVPYNGTGPALTALISGQVDYMCDQIVNVVQQVESGQIKAYAIGTPERSPALPNVPTSKEAGLPEFQAEAWNALFAPKGTPQPILDKLSDALNKALDDPNARKRLLDLGSVLPEGPARGQKGLATLVGSEMERWSKVIKAAGPLE
jgi:tripartite-type tricarboxylate transporter receptor subunit TctC